MNDGTLAQDLVRNSLLELQRTKPCTFERLYDSKAAGCNSGGNFIPSVAADFIVSYKGIAGLLEVKSSVKHNSLTECTLRSVFSDHQIAASRLWQRAGSIALCVFFGASKRFEVWDMLPVSKAYLALPRKRKLIGVPYIEGSQLELTTLLIETYRRIKCITNYIPN